MYHKVEPGTPASICDEIAVLAERYLMEPGKNGLQRIDAHIAAAMADSRWDDMSKWHRVRFRLIRLQQQRDIGGRLGCDSR
ncbi:MAG: hypothetical protein EOP60_19335 [Sphingomonadales bacterium]|nr:MAG: hypothetical protein EOP60_19335 [Sphingomonadales bacterium]